MGLITENKGSLGIGLDNDRARFLGIIGYHLLTDSAVHAGHSLSLSLDGCPNFPVIELRSLGPSQRYNANVHQFLLPRGPQRLIFRLLDTDGAVCFEQVHPIERSEPTELASRVASKLIGADVPWAFFGPCDAGRYPYADLLPDDPVRPWFDRPDAERHIDKLIENRHVTTTEAQLLRDFIRDGFMVIENAVDPSLIAAVNAEIDHAIAKGWNGYTYGSSQRIELLHLSYPNIKRLWLDPAHRRWANLLFGTVARPCQTLTYVFGSQQAEHQDTIHLTTFPPGYMCGAWIALQDVVPHSGELVYYPGSHRERRIYLSELGVGKTLTPPDWQPFEDKALPAWREIAARYPRQIYRPRAGTIAIWHENLLHGGSERDDRRLERRSVVVHSYAEGALAFADSSGITCTAATLGELQVEP